MELIVNPGLLASATTATIFLIVFTIWFRNRDKNRVNLGLSAVVFLSCLYQSQPEILALLDRPTYKIEELVSNIIATLWWLAIAFLFNKSLNRFIWHGKLAWDGEPAVPRLLREIATVLIYLTAGMIILRFVFDQPITAVAATSGVVALVMGYSAQSTLKEIFAGISLNLDDPFQKGDLVEFEGEWGYIKDMNWRSVIYQDMDQNIVVLPNSKVAEGKIRNLTRPTEVMRRTFYFHAEYNAPTSIVLEVAEQAIKECPKVTRHPGNFAAFYEFDELGAKYKMHFHSKNFDDWFAAGDQVSNALWYGLNRRGIRFAFQRHLNFAFPEDDNRLLPDSLLDNSNWENLVTLFNRVPIFEQMQEEDIQDLAKGANWRIFGPPERIVSVSKTYSSMFIIATGRADVFEVMEDGSEIKMDELGPGQAVGIMTILTGVSQQTTIRAAVETAVWEINSDALHAIFERRPIAMDHIAESAAKWQAEEDKTLAVRKLSRAQEAKIIDKRQTSLSKRISRFFVLSKTENINVDFTDY